MRPGGWSRSRLDVAAMLLSAATASCGDKIHDVAWSGLSINTRLRPDLAAVDGARDLTSMSDGGDGGHQIVSPLYFGAIPAEALRQLRRSECIWVGSDAAPVLSYETVVSELHVEDREINLAQMGMCGFSEPETREPFRSDGEIVPITAGVDFPPMGLLTYRQAGLTDAHGQCLDFAGVPIGSRANPADLAAGTTMTDPNDHSQVTLDTSKVDCGKPDLAATPYCHGRAVHPTDQWCRHPLGGYPAAWCAVRCQVDAPTEDTTYGLEIVEEGTGLNFQLTSLNRRGMIPATLAHVKVVDTTVSTGVRKISRPLGFLGTSNQLMSWSWQVADTPRGLWAENFSPQLKVARVRFFLERPGEAGRPPVREDLVGARFPRQIQLQNGRLNTARTCTRPDASTPQLDLEACTGFFVTPTYLHDALDAKLTWQVDFLAPNNVPPFSAGDRVFIEFDLVGVNQSTQSLSVSPPGLDLGNVEVGEAQAFKDRLTVTNAGASSLTIQRLWLEDRQQREDRSGELSVAGLSPVFNPPFVLGPFSSFRITLATHFSRIEEKERWLVVEARSAGAPARRIRAAIQARGVDALLNVAPESLGFHRTAQPQQPVIEYERTLLIENAGYIDLHRNALLLEGTDAREFAVSSSDCGHPSVFASPVPASCRLGPGQAELIKVLYRPGSAGFHNAALRVETDAGEKVVPLTAICGETWRDSAGSTYTRACRY
jgi:hypothetical protein